MSTEAVIVIIAVALVLITLVGWIAGRAENRRRSRQADPPRDAGRAVAPGYANEAAYAAVARAAEHSLRSERDVVLGDEDVLTAERDTNGRFARDERVRRGL